jgi:hypothetical protein
VGGALIHEDRRTDTTKLIATFRDYAKAPKSILQIRVPKLECVCNVWRRMAFGKTERVRGREKVHKAAAVGQYSPKVKKQAVGKHCLRKITERNLRESSDTCITTHCRMSLV